MLEMLIPSKTRVALLTFFLLNPGRSYYIREIAREIDDKYEAVRKELINLEKFGLLISEKKGNQIHYSVNELFFLYEELQKIILKTEGVVKSLKENLSLVGSYVDYLFIYGSFASGKANSKSDIDLMIVADFGKQKRPRNQIIETINNSESLLGREINFTIYSKDEFLNRIKEKDPFISNIMNKSKIWIKGQNEFENIGK